MANTFKVVSTDVVRWSYASEDKIGIKTKRELAKWQKTSLKAKIIMLEERKQTAFATE